MRCSNPVFSTRNRTHRNSTLDTKLLIGSRTSFPVGSLAVLVGVIITITTMTKLSFLLPSFNEKRYSACRFERPSPETHPAGVNRAADVGYARGLLPNTKYFYCLPRPPALPKNCIGSSRCPLARVRNPPEYVGRQCRREIISKSNDPIHNTAVRGQQYSNTIDSAPHATVRKRTLPYRAQAFVMVLQHPSIYLSPQCCSFSPLLTSGQIPSTHRPACLSPPAST